MNDEQMIWKVYESNQKTKSCSEFGLFGRIMDKIDKENDILTEALITSYPYSNVLSMFNAFLILIILNTLLNCAFTYAIHCMDLRKRLTLYY